MDDINTPFCNHIIFSPFDQMKEKCNSATCDKTSEKFPIPVGLEGTAVLRTPPQPPPTNGGSASTSDLDLPGESAGCSEALWCQPGLHTPLRTPHPAGWGFSTSVPNSAPREEEEALSPHASLPRPSRPGDPRAGGWRVGGMDAWLRAGGGLVKGWWRSG